MKRTSPIAVRPKPGGGQVALLAVTLGCGALGTAVAFPLVESGVFEQVPEGTELSSPDVQDLRHQLQIVNGLGAPAGGGWTFVPRIDIQEMLTDNVLEQSSPRRWDAATFVSPGFSLVGDLPRLSANFSYVPTVALYARQGSLNALTHQLNGIGLLTLAPDLAYLDVRATAGVHNAFGGFGGLGGVGGTDFATGQSAIPSLAGNAQGLNRNNEVQSGSISVSPYLLGNFGEWGTGKLGYSANATRSDTLSGFFATPFPAGGSNSQTLLSHEANAQYATGDNLGRIQNTIDLDYMFSQNTTDGGVIDGSTGLPLTVSNHSTSTKAVAADRILYRINRSITVFASGGHEDIVYTGLAAPSIHDLIWSLGTTLTPGPDSKLTISYGHQNGFNSFAADGYYGLTARTNLTLSYGSTLGTQLETLRNQLNLARPGPNGTLINGQTGGPLFSGVNALVVQNGVFRTDTLVVGGQTTLERDILNLSVAMVKQTTTGVGPTSTVTAHTVAGTWVHQMQPDMTLNAGIAFSLQDQNAAEATSSGKTTSVVVSLGWQYEISDSVSLSARVSFFDRHSDTSLLNFYQSMLIVGVSKTF